MFRQTPALFILLVLVSACSGPQDRSYVAPTTGPLAKVTLFASAIKSSAANTELDYEIFRLQPNCSIRSLGWIKLDPSDHNKMITVAANEVLFMRLDYFQTDIVLARNSRGEVKFAFEPTAGKEYTIENTNNRRLFEMEIYIGDKNDNIVPLEWNVRNEKVVFRGELDCNK